MITTAALIQDKVFDMTNNTFAKDKGFGMADIDKGGLAETIYKLASCDEQDRDHILESAVQVFFKIIDRRYFIQSVRWRFSNYWRC